VSAVADDAVVTPLSRLLWKRLNPGLEFVHKAIDGEFWTSLRNIEMKDLLSC
jgi:hypothetical protein